MNSTKNEADTPASRSREAIIAELGLTLSRDHHARLRASAISDEVILDRGYFSILSPMHLSLLGLQSGPGPVMAIPEYTIAGNEVRYTLRPDNLWEPGKRYINEAKKESRITASPGAREALLSDSCREVVLVEGGKKADSLTSIGVPACSMPGVWNFGSRPAVGLGVYSDIEALRPNGKTMILGFDSDSRTNSQVMRALHRLTQMLRDRGADVRWAIPPTGEDGQKNGIDDYLASFPEADRLQAFKDLIAEPDEDPLLSAPMSDAGNAERLAHQFAGLVHHVPGVGWHQFDGMRHRRVSAPLSAFTETMRATQEAAAKLRGNDQKRQDLLRWGLQSENIQRANGALKFAEQLMRAEVGDFNQRLDLFNCLSGTIDLKTGEQHPHSPEDLISQLCPVEFDPEAECPHFEAMLRFALDEDEDQLAYFQRYGGYCLTGETREKQLMFMVGRGDTGKTTVTNTLSELMGLDYATSVDESTLGIGSRKRSGNEATPDVAELLDKRFVKASETPAKLRLNVERVKGWTGSNNIVARQMYREIITFPPRFKLLIETNDFPNMKEGDTPLWNRIHIIEFACVIPKDQQDQDLPEKLRKEFPGILAWMVRGAIEWYRIGLSKPKRMDQTIYDYQVQSDPVVGFIQEHCEIGEGLSMKKERLYQHFKVDAEKGGDLHPITAQQFNRRVQDVFGPMGVYLDGRAWRGIQLAPKDEDAAGSRFSRTRSEDIEEPAA